MVLLLWVLLSFLAAFMARHRPLATVLTALILACLLPAAAATAVFSGPADVVMHPGAVLVAAACVVQLARRPADQFVAWQRCAEIVVAASAACGVMMGLSIFAGGGDAPSFVVDQVAAPLAAFLTVGAEVARHPEMAVVVRRVLLTVGCVEGLFAQFQSAVGGVILFASGYASQTWFVQSGDAGRWMGTLDHPLVLSLVLVGCIPLVATVRRGWVTIALLVILVGGVLASQSRTGIALAAIGAAYVLYAGRVSGRVRLAMWGAAGVVGASAVASGAFNGVLSRFNDATDQSNAARAWAGDYFWDRLVGQYVWTGRGSGASYHIAQEGGLISSFENSFYIYTLDYGLVTTVLYFGVMVACLVVCILRGVDRSWAVAGALMLVSAISFSGLGTRSAAPMVMWVVFAVAAFGGRRLLPSAESRRQGPAAAMRLVLVPGRRS